jgi:hypothetical protein
MRRTITITITITALILLTILLFVFDRAMVKMWEADCERYGDIEMCHEGPRRF